jgi:hypothetical protein
LPFKNKNNNKNKMNEKTAMISPKLMMTCQDTILELIQNCLTERSLSKKREMLYHINSLLVRPDQLKIPSTQSHQLTTDYINMALHIIEGKVF